MIFSLKCNFLLVVNICCSLFSYHKDIIFNVDYVIVDGEETSADVSLQESVSQCLQLNDSVDENKPTETDILHSEGVRCNEQENLGFDNDKISMIRVLEQALEEGYADRDALYLELEKERSAAATAADEAMAMILRLQEEKASIEMEARQYQRMIEEKYAYDAEEMGILKEILVRREREKHFLEKEVEEYRQMIFGNDQLGSGMHDLDAMEAQMTSSYSCEDPYFMPHSQSIKNPTLKITDSSSDFEVSSIEIQNRKLAFGKKLPILELDEDSDPSKQGDVYALSGIDSHVYLSGNKEANYEFQEKGVISMYENLISDDMRRRGAGNTEGHSLHEKATSPFAKEHDQTGSTSLFQEFDSKTSDISIENEQDLEIEKPPSLLLDTESRVYDVHVIDDENILHSKLSIDKTEQLLTSATLNVPIKCDSPTLSRVETEDNKIGSSLCVTSGLPPKGSSSGKALLTDLRRNSMSAIDYERVKIDNEVEWLRERLRIVQEGREKLNFSLGHKEREKIQLQLLEDIANQLREIRQLTEPGKAVRQASLPPSSSKVNFLDFSFITFFILYQNLFMMLRTKREEEEDKENLVIMVECLSCIVYFYLVSVGFFCQLILMVQLFYFLAG